MKLNQNKLAVLMAQKELRQGELARLAGVARPTCSYVINGRSCNPVTANKIARALGVDVAEIIEEVK